jgi:hypothetical protein
MAGLDCIVAQETLTASAQAVRYGTMRERAPAVYIAVYHRSPGSDWPEDHGDDPSFGASREFAARGGALSWGVCRQDVRNPLRLGDLVVFFATDRLADRRPQPVRYQFVGFATVDKKVSQVDIWHDRAFAVYRKYRNLLIRPDGADRFEHFEPTLPRRRWHGDWYWRIADIRRRHKHEFERIHARAGFSVHDRSIAPVAPNYVLFAPDGRQTLILADPPLVATAASAGRREEWEQTRFARGLQAWLRAHTHRSLRTTNAHRAHRHITIRGADVEGCRAHLRQLCSAAGLRRRGLGRATSVASSTNLGSSTRTCG